MRRLVHFLPQKTQPSHRRACQTSCNGRSGVKRKRTTRLAASVFAAAVVAAAQPGATFVHGPRCGRTNRQDPQGTNIKVLPNGVNMVNVPLRAIIQLAYGVQQPSRLVSVPNWAAIERFDITAKSDAITSRDQLRSMLQALLADRFKLAAHAEMRDQPIYVLMRARPNEAPGPSLRPSTAVCAQTQCGPRPGGPGKVILVGSPISQLASVLSLAVGRTVVDGTGLAGNYDVELSYAQEEQPPDQDGPSLFTALREQLGLQLKPEREKVDVLVVDRVDRPTEN